MSFEKILADVGQTNPSQHRLKNRLNQCWPKNSLDWCQLTNILNILWQKKNLFDVDRKIALVDVGLKTSLVVVRQNNPS